jgi:hypothetical protein
MVYRTRSTWRRDGAKRAPAAELRTVHGPKTLLDLNLEPAAGLPVPVTASVRPRRGGSTSRSLFYPLVKRNGTAVGRAAANGLFPHGTTTESAGHFRGDWRGRRKLSLRPSLPRGTATLSPTMLVRTWRGQVPTRLPCTAGAARSASARWGGPYATRSKSMAPRTSPCGRFVVTPLLVFLDADGLECCSLCLRPGRLPATACWRGRVTARLTCAARGHREGTKREFTGAQPCTVQNCVTGRRCF